MAKRSPLPLGNCQFKWKGTQHHRHWKKVSGITVCPVVTVEQENSSKLNVGGQLGLRAVLGTRWHGNGKRHRLDGLPP